MKLVVLGLSITSSWGNGHATTWRALLRALAARGHSIVFLERDVPWYAQHRDLPAPPFCTTLLYDSLDALQQQHMALVRDADVVMIGSFVPAGRAVADWVFATARGAVTFYDIDTPVTLAALSADRCEYISRAQLPRFDAYFSFTGGPLLARLEQEFAVRAARPLYCSVDPALYFPANRLPLWDLGYMGTYSADRQPAVERLLFQPARSLPSRHFVLVGPQYPESLAVPHNVERISHLAPSQHRHFYSAQRYTLNVTRADMIAAGYSPSVRLFEAAACGTAVISDAWEGLDSFFEIGREIIVADDADEVMAALQHGDSARAQRIGSAARRRVLAQHTAAQRALELETYLAARPLAHSV